MSAILQSPASAARPAWRGPAILAAILLIVMAIVWWSFFSLRSQQSVRVLFSAGNFTQSEARSGVAKGNTLRTGDDGFASVRLSDGSIVRLMPNTRLDIEDARSNVDSDRFTTSLRLLSGEIETRVPTDDGATRELNLFSNSVAIGVRGTVFSVMQSDDAARVMVTRGRVEAKGTVGDSVEIGSNQGSVVSAGAAIGEVSTLPDAPRPDSAVQTVDEGLSLSWQSARPQSAYVLELARDEAFDNLVRRYTVTWQQGVVPPLERDGAYWWRVASVDARGLRGAYSESERLQQDYYIRRSREALLRGDTSAVRENLAQASEALDADIDRLRSQALEAISQRRYDDAKGVLETVLELRAQDALARNALAKAQYNLLDYDAATRNYNLAIDTQGVAAQTAADAQSGLALIELRQGRFDSALQRATAVLDERSTHLDALNVAAMASIGLGRHDEARRFLSQALSVRADDPTASLLLQSLQAPAPQLPAAGTGGGS